ncbi:MAG: YciI-like protein [Acidobacteria bacterium]|nr:YciI-like protein [Acidobacteriota bacterium]
MNYYALFYDVVDDFVERRSRHREEHLRLAREAHQRGELLLAGALSDPADRTLLIFRAPDISVVEEFARHDPYVISGLVTRWEARYWTVVIGNEPSIAPLTESVGEF